MYFYLEFRLRYLKNLKLFSIRVKRSAKGEICCAGDNDRPTVMWILYAHNEIFDLIFISAVIDKFLSRNCPTSQIFIKLLDFCTKYFYPINFIFYSFFKSCELLNEVKVSIQPSLCNQCFIFCI